MKTFTKFTFHILIVLIISQSSIKAQDFQAQLEQATRNLVNPIYAIIEVPQPDGSIQQVEIKKTELDKINLLETNYKWLKDEVIAIDKAIFYKKENKSEYIQITLTENCNIDTSLVMIAPAMNKKITIPVECYSGTYTKRTIITKTVTIPAQYDTITELVLIKPASTRIEMSTPHYETITEIIKVAPDSARWIRRYGPGYSHCSLGSPKEREIWIMVEVPARYQLISKKVLKFPAHSKEITIPAEYKTIKKRILVAPETTKEVTEYMTETITELLPDITKTIQIPAEYKPFIQTVFKDSTKVIQIDIPIDYKAETDNNTARIQTTDIIKYYQPKSTNVSIFPNPATDKINIQSADNIEQITIFDAQGRVVFSDFYKNEKNVQIEINDFNNGFYSIQVKTNVTLQTSKILKQ